MKHKTKILLGVLIMAVTWLQTGCAREQEVVFTGIIEGKELMVYSRVSGQVVDITRDEGDQVMQEDQLALIEDDSLSWQMKEVEAAAAATEARYREALAGTRQGELERGQAQVAQSSAGISQSQARLNQAEAAVRMAEASLRQAETNLRGAQETYAFQAERFQDMEALYAQGALARHELETQRELLNQTATQLSSIEAQKDVAEAQTVAARGEYQAAGALLAAARARENEVQAQLGLLEDGATDFDLEYLQAAKTQADARVEQIRTILENLTINAPMEGYVLRRHVDTGELVRPGTVLFTLLDPEVLEITIYIPQEEITWVNLNQIMDIQVDAHPERRFQGRIVHISEKAEFTPRNIQTSKERAKMVFAVKIRLLEGHDALRPGMVADVLFAAANERGN